MFPYLYCISRDHMSTAILTVLKFTPQEISSIRVCACSVVDCVAIVRVELVGSIEPFSSVFLMS